MKRCRALDVDAVTSSVRETNRLVIVDEDYVSFGLADEIAAAALEARLTPTYARVCVEDPIPYTRHLEDAALPNVGRIVEAVRGML